jgi:DNA-directed RNA polymerase
MNAFMPNLIHSLDAAFLAMFIDLFYKDNNNEMNSFFAFHDCFATTANNIPTLIKLLKIVYINIYSKDN